MANVTTEQRLIDMQTRTIIKLTGTIDGASGQITPNVAVDVSTLAYASNANGMVMVSNTHPKQSYRTTIKKIIADVTGGYVILAYQQNSANNTIWTLGPGFREIDLDRISIGPLTNPESNTQLTSGDIVLSTQGFGANGAYTILMEIKKDARDYISGYPTNNG